jgi:hypothetical protein
MGGKINMQKHQGKIRCATAFLFILYSLFFSTQCTKLSPEELAALAAKGYYTHLAVGEYEQFLEGRVGAADLPDDYREQLLAGYKQFMAGQQREHRGIREVQVGNARTDSALHYTSVFLILCYGDSTQEEIVVPMVEHNGRWMMK